MRLPRWIHKLYANTLGYFWLPCPICGRMFGGHEIADNFLMQDEFRGLCVCRNCNDEAGERTKRLLGW